MSGSMSGIFSLFTEKTALPLPDKPSIAVLPFENMTGDPKQEYFTDGFTEEIITSLSKISSLFVISRNSSFTYKGKPVKVQKVGKELGVRYVLEGSIQKSGDRVRINAQLIDAISDQHLWAEHYDRDMKDTFALQDEIIFKILTALQVNLTSGEEARVWAKGTKNLEAYLNLMQVREILFQGNVAGNARARQLIEETIALDPKYALAYMYMGSTHFQDFLYNMMALNKTTKSPKESLAQAIEWTQKALAMDDTLAEAHARLGHLYSLSLRHEESIVEVDKAMAMDPNSAIVQYYACIIYRIAGKPAEAIPMCKKAIRLEPFAPGTVLREPGNGFFPERNRLRGSRQGVRKGAQTRARGDDDTHMGDHRLQRVRQGEGSTENGKGTTPDQPEIFGGGLYQKDPAKPEGQGPDCRSSPQGGTLKRKEIRSSTGFPFFVKTGHRFHDCSGRSRARRRRGNSRRGERPRSLRA